MLAAAYKRMPQKALAVVACQKHQMATAPMARLERLTWLGVTAVRTTTVRVKKFELDDGVLDYDDAKTGGPPIHLQNLNLTADRFALDSPFEINLAMSALGSAQDLKVQADDLGGARRHIAHRVGEGGPGRIADAAVGGELRHLVG